MFMSEAKRIRAKPANFFVAGEKKPRFNLSGVEDVTKSENATTIIAANALRTHENIFIGGKANVANGFIMNGIEMSNKQDRSLPMNENKVAFADERDTVEFFAEAFKKLFLRRSKKMFELDHAGTSIFWRQELQRRISSPTELVT